jgi:hypothetical protein
MKTIRLGCLAAVLALVVAVALPSRLALWRSALRPPSEPDLSRVPPSVALVTVVLGGFRGLVADLLWFRASSLQEEGRFLEIVPLADWITKLEPTIPEVWAFHAWNMAYNISALFPDPKDRWRWIGNGRRILQEEALRYHPASPRLHAELSWLYYHKIGGYSDPAADRYLALFFEEIASQLPDGQMETAPADAVARFIERYRLRPETLNTLSAQWGPFDWRLPETHALYWAFEGVRVAGAPPDIRADRMVYLALIASFLRGRAALARPGAPPIRGLRPELAEAVMDRLSEMARRYPDPEYRWDEVAAFFLKRASFYLYCYGYDELALRFFERARQAGSATEPSIEAMAVQAAESAAMAGSDYWDQAMALFTEAARRRQHGDEAGGLRCERMGRLFYEGVRKRLLDMGVASLPSTDALVVEGERLVRGDERQENRP